MRLFFAFELPQDQSDALAAIAPARGAGVRPVSAGRMHVTLRFVGPASPIQAQALAVGLAGMRIDDRDLRVRIEGVGVFPGTRRARVLWAGLWIHEDLVSIQRALEDLCHDVGIEPDPAVWHPHLTLARFDAGPPLWLEDYLDRQADLRLDPFPVDRITLYDSRSSATGSEYVVLASTPSSSGRR